MEAGKLRQKITFKKLQTAQNAYGEVIQNWSDFATVRASKEQLLGNEYFKAEAVQSQVEVKFRTRYLPGIDNTMRIQHGSEVYVILSAINVQSLNKELLIYCKLVVPGG